jgi:branched-chain amino acid aminotransferase
MIVAKSKYLCYNGDFQTYESCKLQFDNRAFRYGDALFESIHACGTEAQFLELHLNRLKHSMAVLKMVIPVFFTTINLSQMITKLLNKNRIFGGARIRLTVFRDASGLYTPAKNDVSFIIESQPLEVDRYELNQRGYVIDIYTEMPKPLNSLSAVKSTSALFYVMAGIYKSEKNLDECILLNEKGHLVESISSNLFIIKNSTLFTPSLKEGCLPGIMRQVIISFLPFAGLNVNEEDPLDINHLLQADEVFLTNAINGIRWVGALQQKRYYHEISENLLQKINQLAFGS